MIEFTTYPKEVQEMMDKVLSTLNDELQEIPEAYYVDLQLLADALTMYTKARDSIKKDGILINGRNGEKVKNPAIAVWNSTTLYIARLLSQFGLNRMAKSRLKENTSGLNAQQLLDALTQ